jgi:2-C-methyl-D-erythritol 4-phosphate cytidylyltransferase
MSASAILLAAGRGDRLGLGTPKAFAELGGETLLARAGRAVDACAEIASVVVTAPPGLEARAEAVLGGSAKLAAVVTGGDTRQDSVRRGLAALPASVDRVVCHDVARALATAQLFSAVLVALGTADGAVPAIPVNDTVKRLDGGLVAETIPRDGLVLVQTPQAFRREPLERAHARAAEEGFVGTDDAALLERAGFAVVAVPGDERNLKITDPVDLERAEALLAGG